MFEKCEICNKRKNLKYITHWASYEPYYTHYHEECYEKVLKNPHMFSSKEWKIATEIFKAKEADKERAIEARAELEKCIQKMK